MATYNVTAPDGTKYQVTAPDDATPDQVQAYVQQQHAQMSGQSDDSGQRYAQLHAQLSALPPEQRQAAVASLSPQDQQVLQQGQRAVARAAMSPQAIAQNYARDQSQQTEDMGGFNRFMAGAGESVYNTGRGIGQLVGAESNQDIADSKAQDAALDSTASGKLGNVAGQIAQMAIPVGDIAKPLAFAGKAAPYLKAAITAGTFGGLQPVEEGQTRAGNALESAAYGATGEGLTRGLGAIAQKAAPVVSDAKQAAIQTLRNAGVPMSAANLSDSTFLKYATSAANALPFSGGAASKAAQQDAFNGAVGDLIGAPGAKSISPEVLANAEKAKSNAYNALFARNSVTISPEDVSRLNAIAKQAESDLPPDQAQVVKNQIAKYVNAAGDNDGQIPGRLYQNIRATLRPIESSSSPSGYLVGQVRKAMQDAANNSFQGNDAQLLQRLNALHANQQVVKKALKQTAGANWDVQPSALWNLIRTKYGATPEMYDLAQAGQLVLKDNARDSGTAIRNQIYKAMVPATAGAGFVGGIPAAAGTLAAMGGTGATVGRALNSKAAANLLPGLASKSANALSYLSQPAPYLLPALANQK